MIKRERFLLGVIKIPNFIRCRISNFIYSCAFSCSNLKIGRNVSISNSKQIFIGDNVYIGNQSWFDAIDKGVICIGSDVSFSQNVHIAACHKVTIGNGCLIGSDVLITDHDHSFSKNMINIIPKNRPLTIKGETELSENVWLGDNVKILSGVKLGRNVIVAANSVVTRSFPDNVIVAGIPGTIIKNLE
ncbi:acyltransferase [Xenorhabdus sp. SF857]|uniref:acyltransferase n=1 Tax=Xenorhabdus bakwenae TaxID=3026967 RepID=UPI0025580D15|nr:acyltransferase [Xenorhabdus sp. SF857]WFQ78873.1 acyltransferase [Xenorhabdus sp. SF857]